MHLKMIRSNADGDGNDIGDGEKVVKEDIEDDEKKEGVSH